MTVTIYTGAWCAPCKMLKTYLAHKGIHYTEKPVEEASNAEEAFRVSGVTSVPVAVIDNEVVVGYNLPQLSAILNRG